jgi:hypothetical protein
MKPTWKVFLMAVIGFLVTTVSVLQDFNFWYVALVTVAFAGEYALKNYLFPSTSPEGQVYWKDIVSGLFLAVCMALNVLGANLLTGTEFSLTVFWTVIIGAVVGYFTKTVPQGVKTS